MLLSGLSADEVDNRLPRLPSYTAETVTTRARLRRELAEVREQGYAVAVDELEVGLTAIAAPIRNAHGDVIASLSVSGPTFRLGEAAGQGARAGGRRTRPTRSRDDLVTERP